MSSIVVCPDLVSCTDDAYRTWLTAALAHCAQYGDRFLIVDCPNPAFRGGEASLQQALMHFRTALCPQNHCSYAAAYAPWLACPWTRPLDPHANTISLTIAGVATVMSLSQLQQTHAALYAQLLQAVAARTDALPPSGAMAGIYVKTDRERGVWKAPSNSSLQPPITPCRSLTADLEEVFRLDASSGKSVNMIRHVQGRGVQVWGGRTLAGNDPEWRYISVRRQAIMLRTMLIQTCRTYVFEDNSAATWQRLRHQIEGWCQAHWMQGALIGAKPELAYFVKIGLGHSMTATDIAQGRLIVELGFAPLRAGEFIVLRYAQPMAPAAPTTPSAVKPKIRRQPASKRRVANASPRTVGGQQTTDVPPAQRPTAFHAVKRNDPDPLKLKRQRNH